MVFTKNFEGAHSTCSSKFKFKMLLLSIFNSLLGEEKKQSTHKSIECSEGQNVT